MAVSKVSKKVEPPQAPKWKPYGEMTLKEMQELKVPQDLIEDFFPNEFE